MKKTRRTVSLKGDTYRRLKAYCKATNSSISGFVEGLVNAHLDEAKFPEVCAEEKGPIPPPLPPPEVPATEAEKHFTF